MSRNGLFFSVSVVHNEKTILTIFCSFLFEGGSTHTFIFTCTTSHFGFYFFELNRIVSGFETNISRICSSYKPLYNHQKISHYEMYKTKIYHFEILSLKANRFSTVEFMIGRQFMIGVPESIHFYRYIELSKSNISLKY